MHHDPAADAESAADGRAMQRLAAGQDAALDELMERHAGRLCAYLRRMLDHHADAEDLAQEVFVRVYQHRARFDPNRPFGAWLYAIAGNLVRDRYRWRARHAEASLEALSETASGAAMLGAAPATSATQTPGEDLARLEVGEAVQRAVGELPLELREAVVLAEFEERSHQEIGEVLGCTAKAVEMKLYRARALLRKRLGGWLKSG
ncbi:MAG: sigma-70 family RNA polymerase sigma factor [Verrucomicrobiales bacterium]|nr:sigma-70 family RNA polymerase sigma factor [Verrucomicrobiales bacterium]